MVALCKPGGRFYLLSRLESRCMTNNHANYKVSLHACFGVSFINNARDKLTINVCYVN